MKTIEVEVSEELLTLANLKGVPPSRVVSKLIALELFREHRVSLGKAAELAEVSPEEFMNFSAQREVPLHYSMEDWEADQTTAREM